MCYFYESSFLFYLSFNFDFCVFKIMHLLPSPVVILLLAVPKRLFRFGSLVILDAVCFHLLLLLSYINIEIGKNKY